MNLPTSLQNRGGFPLKNSNNNIPANTTLSYSILGENSDHKAISDQQTVQGYAHLLKEHMERLQTAIRRSESFSLRPSPRYMNQKEVISYLGHEKIFSILVEEYGLKPIRQEHRCNIYCSKQVEEKCIQFEHNIAA